MMEFSAKVEPGGGWVPVKALDVATGPGMLLISRKCLEHIMAAYAEALGCMNDIRGALGHTKDQAHVLLYDPGSINNSRRLLR